MQILQNKIAYGDLKFCRNMQVLPESAHGLTWKGPREYLSKWCCGLRAPIGRVTLISWLLSRTHLALPLKYKKKSTWPVSKASSPPRPIQPKKIIKRKPTNKAVLAEPNYREGPFGPLILNVFHESPNNPFNSKFRT